MKKIILLVILSLLLFINIKLVIAAPFCCQTAPKSMQFRCYSSGYCCDIGTYENPSDPKPEQLLEYWSPDPCDISSYNFKMWIAGPSTYTVGQKIQVILYLQNVGEYRDSYDITFTNSNPTLILVDPSGISPVNDLDPGEIRFVYPRITVLASTAIGDVIFKGTSKTITSITKEASLHIVSETPMSLPEFGFLGLIGIIVLVGFLYFARITL